MKPKQQRLILGVAAIVALGIAAAIALAGLKDKASYFYSPSDLANARVTDRAVRLGGMVVPGSIKRAADGVTIDFVVKDESKEIPVRFHGIPPELFKEGSGVVAEGRLGPDGSFAADSLLAKHDENYKPPQMQDGRHKTGKVS